MKKRPDRLSRETWLEKSLEILAFEGEGKLTIDHLVKAMGVSKGSFYWHFKNRADFIKKLVEYWSTEYTATIAEELAEIKDPKERLLHLMLGLTEGNHSRYDIAMLNWGQHEASARAKLREVYDYRMGYVRSIFEEMGFSGDALEMRVQTMVFFQSMESSKYTRLSKKERMRHVKLRHQMLIAK